MTPALLLGAFLVPLVLAPFATVRRGRWLPALAILPGLAAAALVPADTTLDLPWLLLGSTLSLDTTGRWFLGAGAVIWLAAALTIPGTVRDARAGRFRLFFTLAMAGNLWLTVAGDAVGFYLGFALMGIAAYGLVAHHATPAARRAGRIYLGWTVSGEVALFSGLVMMAAAAGGHDLATLAAVTPPGTAVALVVAGFGIKIALPGLHLWLPAAYAAAPGAGAAVLSGPLIGAGLLGLLRFLPPGDPGLLPWGEALVAMGLAGAFYGVAMGLPQRDPRVVLGYSSVAKMGVLTAGLGVALATPAAAPGLVAAIVLYAAHHTLVKGGLFLGLDLLAARPPAPWVKGGLVVLALVLAGAPYTGGAAAKSLLGDALPPGTEGLSDALTGAAVAAVMLMARFVYLVLRQPAAPREPPAAAAALPWTALLVVVLVAPPLVAPAADPLSGWPPFLVAAATGLAFALAWPPGRPLPFAWIPPGDLLHLLPTLPRRTPAEPAPAPHGDSTPATSPVADSAPAGASPTIQPWSAVAWLALGALLYAALRLSG